jgi:hypothetical protein
MCAPSLLLLFGWLAHTSLRLAVLINDSELMKITLRLLAGIEVNGAMKAPARFAFKSGSSRRLGGTANLAVLGGNLPPSRAHKDCSPFSKYHARSAVGLVARQNGPVARSTLK